MFQLIRRCSCLFLALFVLAGCDELGKINWSPDGQHCAILSKHGLQIGDSSGVIHSEAAVGNRIFEWLPDSKSAVVVVAKKATWSDLTKLISAADLKAISADATYFWLHREQMQALEHYKRTADFDFSVSNLYLKNRYGQSYRTSSLYKKLEGSSSNIAALIYTVQIYDFTVSPALSGLVLLQTAKEISALHVSPDGRSVAISEKENTGCKLSVLSTNGKERKVIARKTSANFCWSQDSKALYFACADNASSNASFKHGTLKKAVVAGQNGPLLPVPDKAIALASIEFSDANILHCLPDGSLLFKSQEFQVPQLENDRGLHSRIFALKANGKKLDKLSLSADAPECNVQSFAVNHSGTKLVASSDKGQVWLIDLQTHSTCTVQGEVGDTKLAPTWRTDDEFTYAVRNHVRASNGHDVEVVLRNANDGSERIISRNWSVKDMSFLQDETKDSSESKAKLKSK